METNAEGEPAAAGLRYHQLLHLYRQQQHAENWPRDTTNRAATICVKVGLSYVLDGENGLSLCHHLLRAAAEKLLVHGQEYLCVLKYSASFAGEQLHSLTTSLSKVLQALRRFPGN